MDTTLINVLFSFLVPVIIIVSVIARVYGAVKDIRKTARNNSSRKLPSPPPAAKSAAPLWREGFNPEVNEADEWMPPEADDEDDWKPPKLEEDIKPTAVSVLAACPQLSVKPPAPVPGLAEKPGYTPLISGEAEQAAVPAFFRRLEAMPYMRQAVILTEILGPPKGE
jgi:hypothetical protein